MISFNAAPAPRPPRNSGSFRKRVLSVLDEDGILYAVTTSNSTEIVLVEMDGLSKTVLAVNHYMDIVTADLSEDREMITYTERICPTSAGSFTFRTILRHIHSFADIKVSEEVHPIFSFFVPGGGRNTYHLVHSVSRNMFHCEATIVTPQKKIRKGNGQPYIEVKKMRNGVNISGCSKWFYSRTRQELYIFRGKDCFEAWSFTAKGTAPIVLRTYMEPASLLPPELSLLPSVPSQLPYYRFSSGIMFVMRVESDYAVIEQLYKPECEKLTLSVTLIGQNDRRIFSIEGATADMPVNFISHGMIVFAFVVNCGMVVLDFSVNPVDIFGMPKAMVGGPCDLTVSIDDTNVVVDLNKGGVYRCGISVMELPENVNFSDRRMLFVLALLAGHLPYRVSLSLLFRRLIDEEVNISLFMKDVFAVGMTLRRVPLILRTSSSAKLAKVDESRSALSERIRLELAEMEIQFPSTGISSRVDYFYQLVMGLKRSERSVRKATKRALEHLRAQNKLAVALQNGVDEFERTTSDTVLKFCVALAVLGESQRVVCPDIPCLKEEVELQSYQACTTTIRRHLVVNGLTGHGYGRREMPSKDKTEIEYWNARFPLEMLRVRRPVPCPLESLATDMSAFDIESSGSMSK